MEFYQTFNNDSPNHRVGLHYILDISGRRFLYTYIRKNGCTAFKKLFIEEGNAANREDRVRNPLGYMEKYHSYNIVDTNSVDCKLFVYRDPVERLISLYLNKFVVRDGFHQIFSDLKDKTAMDPDQLTFGDFCCDYVNLIRKGKKLDPHVIPQHWHLLPTFYDAAIPLSNLANATRDLFGFRISELYFKEPVNSTRQPVALDLRPEAPAYLIPSLKLHHDYLAKRKLPARKDMVNNSIRELIMEIYSDDYKMLAQINPV